MLEGRSLTKYYKGKAVLQDVSFSVAAGEVLGIIGPNGAGKSTLLRIVSAIIDADSGEVNIDGKAASIGASGTWGYLPEERGLYPQMKVLEQLVHFASLKGYDTDKAKSNAIRLLQEWKMDQYLQANADTLSKGNQQRIQFLSAILHDPLVIILDEPFSGLDPVQADWLKNQILLFRKQGKLILYSSHRMDSVEALCDRILVLHDGARVAYGAVHELYPQTQDTWQALIKGGNETWHKTVNVLDKQEQSNGCVWIKFSMTDHDLTAVVAAVVQSGAVVESIKRDRPSLHELFVQLTTGTHVA